jgi:hypothetical protein
MKYIDTDLANMLSMSLDHLLPGKVEQWKASLAQGRLTLEMRDVFAGIGWLSSSRDSRLKDEPADEEPTEGTDEPEPIEIREPEVKPGKPEKPVPSVVGDETTVIS